MLPSNVLLRVAITQEEWFTHFALVLVFHLSIRCIVLRCFLFIGGTSGHQDAPSGYILVSGLLGTQTDLCSPRETRFTRI